MDGAPWLWNAGIHGLCVSALERILAATRDVVPSGGPWCKGSLTRWPYSDPSLRLPLRGVSRIGYALRPAIDKQLVINTTWKVMSQISDTLKNSCFEIKGLQKQH